MTELHLSATFSIWLTWPSGKIMLYKTTRELDHPKHIVSIKLLYHVYMQHARELFFVAKTLELTVAVAPVLVNFDEKLQENFLPEELLQIGTRFGTHLLKA